MPDCHDPEQLRLHRFENVQETELSRIAGKPIKVVLVVGEQHKRLPVTLVKKLLQHESHV